MRKQVFLLVLIIIIISNGFSDGFYIVSRENMAALRAYRDRNYQFDTTRFKMNKPLYQEMSVDGKTLTLYNDKWFYNLNGCLFVVENNPNGGNRFAGESIERQCVDFVRGLCEEIPGSLSWRRSAASEAANWANLPSGTIIARFANDKQSYTGIHVAIFDRYEDGKVYVFDQNFGSTYDYETTKFRYHAFKEDYYRHCCAINNPNADLKEQTSIFNKTCFIRSVEKNTVFDVSGESIENGAKIIHRTYNGGMNQKFRVEPCEIEGEYRIVSCLSKKVIEIQNSSKQDGAQIQTWEYNPNYPTMHWHIHKISNGLYQIINVNSGLALEAMDDGSLKAKYPMSKPSQFFEFINDVEKKDKSLGQKTEVENMVLIPAGTFKMGDEYDVGEPAEEKPLHTVTLTNDYYIGTYEVTNEEFVQFLNGAGVVLDSDYGKIENRNIIDSNNGVYSGIDHNGTGWVVKTQHNNLPLNYAQMPVVYVTWWGAVEYCNWLSRNENKPEAYIWDENIELWGNDKFGTYKLNNYPNNTGYRLPTEAEWEYAARGAQNYKWAGTSNEVLLTQYAWYRGNSAVSINGRFAHPVGEKLPNGYNLYDMTGNVREWCSDNWYTYTDVVDTNPYYHNPENTDSPFRVTRGGSWAHDSNFCRVSSRGFVSLDDYNVNQALGFRIARTKE